MMFIIIPILFGILIIIGGIMLIHCSTLTWSDGERCPESPYFVAFGVIFMLVGLVIILEVL